MAKEKKINNNVKEGEERTPEEKLADRAVATAIKQLNESVRFQQPRFEEIRKNEDMYLFKNAPALRGRNNIPFDSILLSGFVNTLISKIDEPLSIKFGHKRERDLKAGKKVTAVWEKESAPDMGAWSAADLDGKLSGALAGRVIFEVFSDSVGKEYRSHFNQIDHLDFYCEPQGGPYLDRHIYKYKINNFVSKRELTRRATKKVYVRDQVDKLKATTSDKERKINQDIYKNKVNRYNAMKLDIETNDYVGLELYRLTKGIMKFEGKWYWIVFDYDTGIWLRFKPLEEEFSVAKKYPGRGPFLSWATHRNPNIFWSPAPADPVRPIGVAMKKFVNLSLDNLEKRNWDMTAYDPEVFTEPRKLLYKQDGLVKATLKPGQNINNHIYKFQTPDTASITVNFLQYFNSFLGEKTGITPSAQGQGDEDKVGIYYGNIQQVADRLGLTNKMYEQFYVEAGQNFVFGLYDNMPKKYAVKLIGTKGIEWEEEITKEEVDAGFRISVAGGDAEAKNNALLVERKSRAISEIVTDQALRAKLDDDWLLREKMVAGGFNEEEIQSAIASAQGGDAEIMAEADKAIHEIIDGKEPKFNRGATVAFIAKINDFAIDNDMDEGIFLKLMKYAKDHFEIAKENTLRKARQFNIAKTIRDAEAQPTGEGGGPAPVTSTSTSSPTIPKSPNELTPTP